MKKKELINQIRETALQDMPDVLKRINLDQIRIEPKPESIRKPFNLRAAFNYTFATLVLLVSGVFMFAVIPFGSDNTPLESDTEIVAFQTVSGAALLDSMSLVNLSGVELDNDLIQLSTTTEDESSEDEILDQLQLINQYLNMAETVVGSESQYLYQTIESDRSEYAYAYQYTATDLNGNLITYTGYYNIIETATGEREDGIIYHNGSSYEYTSVAYESGDVTRYYYRLKINEENYVEVKNFSSNTVQQFKYKVYRNGSLDSESTMKVVAVKKRLQASISIQNQTGDTINLDIDRNTANQSSQSLEVAYMLQSQTKSSEGTISVSLEYDETAMTYRYRYAVNNEYVIMQQRGYKGNLPATKDDFTPGNSGSHNPFVSTSENTTSSNGNPQNQGQTRNENQAYGFNQDSESIISTEQYL